MPKGIYKHHPHQLFQKGHKINIGRKHTEKAKRKMRFNNRTHFKKGIYQGYGFKKGNISWSKLHPELMPRGKDHWHWKNGIINHSGYILIHQPEHPFCDNHGYIREHRLIVERQIGRYLLPSEKCHHLGKKDDNRPHMLMAFINQSTHLRFHKDPLLVKFHEIIFDGR